MIWGSSGMRSLKITPPGPCGESGGEQLATIVGLAAADGQPGTPRTRQPRAWRDTVRRSWFQPGLRECSQPEVHARAPVRGHPGPCPSSRRRIRARARMSARRPSPSPCSCPQPRAASRRSGPARWEAVYADGERQAVELGCEALVADLEGRAVARSLASGVALGGEPRVHPFDPALARRTLKAPVRGAPGGPKERQGPREEQDG